MPIPTPFFAAFTLVPPAGRPWRSCCLVYYNYKDSYRGMTYYDSKDRPRYSFGCGLTYTSFSYRLLESPKDAETEKVDCLTLSISITNTGSRPASAVPQLYLHRLQGVATSRVRALCDFQKVALTPGQTREVALTISREALSQWGAGMQRQVPPGKIQWFLEDNGQIYLTGELILK